MLSGRYGFKINVVFKIYISLAFFLFCFIIIIVIIINLGFLLPGISQYVYVYL